ncbi:MAG: PSD1 and planctomycete cytochrome C domain-containing protein [bacterium]
MKGRVEFNRDIRPILSDNCFYCHGPDKSHREAELRLDTAEGLLGNGKKKGVIDKTSIEKSKLLRRIVSNDPDEQMPPPDSGKTLSQKDRDLIKKWVAQGAEFEGHWAFEPVKTPERLGVKSSSSPVSDVIDQFIDQKRSGSKVKPNSEADRITLLRRLSFDLTGLPPTIEEVDHFLNDTSANAWEKQVERLMGSTHYGESMAMWWLDLVRYADSVGYHGDQEVSVSPFRQYVIESFNDNKPFDKFTIEQLGGDLMPDPSQEQKIAAGYNRLGMMSAEGGVQPREYLAKYAAERVRNVSGTWLGVTLGCSECHDHKFDPFTTREFYQMEAFFADIREKGLYSGSDFGSSMKVPTADQQRLLANLETRLKAATDKFNTDTPEIAQGREKWLKSQPVWSVLKPATAKSKNGAELKTLPDGSLLASGKKPDTDTYEIEINEVSANFSAIRLEVLPDDSLAKKGPGRAGNGNFVLTELKARIIDKDGKDSPITFSSAVASYEQTGANSGNPYGKWAVAAAIDNDAEGSKWGWAVMEKAGSAQSAIFLMKTDSTSTPENTADKPVKLVITLEQNHDNPAHTLGRFRLSATGSSHATESLKNPAPAIEPILATPEKNWSAGQREQILAHYRSIAPELAQARADLVKIQKEKTELEKQITTTLVTEQVPPRMIRVLSRGNWMDESGAEVQPGFPAAINRQTKMQSTPEKRLNRLDLARWLVDAENPLTSRVLVNRLWNVFFGEALSRKVDDVGSQGHPPTHPELLDYMAGRMIEGGWDIKKLIKAIVMTKAYRQSSVATPDQRELDPFNMLLARQGRFRLDAEMVRDNALAVSGLLVNKIGGKSVRPYQPPGYWAYLNFPTREWQNDSGESLYRRGLYTHWQRQYLHPSLLAFDAPNREECTADRARSNTPLQSLVLLNDPVYIESARNFAGLILANGGPDNKSRIEFAFRRALSRPAKEPETAILERLLGEALTEYKARPETARELLSVGAKPAPAGADAAELAAWTNVARAILNLHEIITRN